MLLILAWCWTLKGMPFHAAKMVPICDLSHKPQFSESDYESGDGMITAVWGPPLWHVLHTISFNYPV